MAQTPLLNRNLASPLALPFTWQPGEHMTVVGDTGSGKSTLVSRLLSLRRYVLVLRSKPDDVTYQAQRTQRARAMTDARVNRVELAPRNRRSQEAEFGRALDLAYRQGGWTVYVDELFYVDQKLGLSEQIDELLTQGRSLGITVVCGIQRPVQVTRFAMAESVHLLSFGLEGRDVKTLNEVAPRLASEVPLLERYQFAWYHRRSKGMWVGRVQDLEG